jgi:Fe-Mn family superoxide dismutase
VSQTIGIGWVWLAKTNGTLEVLWTDYQNSPFIEGRKPLLALDVWEHAYYLDYQNQRDKYVAAWLEHLVNWEFAEANFA